MFLADIPRFFGQFGRFSWSFAVVFGDLLLTQSAIVVENPQENHGFPGRDTKKNIGPNGTWQERKPGFASGDFLFSPFLRGLFEIIFWGF